MSSNLFKLRDELVDSLRSMPGFVTVGIGKRAGVPVFIVSVDFADFTGAAPESFSGYRVLLQDFGWSVSQVCGGVREMTAVSQLTDEQATLCRISLFKNG
jgi:hypothetical protein